MKYILFFFLSTFVSNMICAQVGINTTNPLSTSIFHIDSSGNNLETGSLSEQDIIDDVIIIDADVQNTHVRTLSIGGIQPVDHNLPSIGLAVKGTSSTPPFILQDGNEGDKKVLMSDVTGVATWKDPRFVDISQGVFSSLQDFVMPLKRYELLNNKAYYTQPTGAYIDLEPGTWVIHVRLKMELKNTGLTDIKLLNINSVWVRSSFSDLSAWDVDTGGEPYSRDIQREGTAGIRISGRIYPSSPGFVEGQIIIKNSTKSIKRYYQFAGVFDVSSNILQNPNYDSYNSFINIVKDAPENYILALKTTI